ncbi:MAG: histidine kinase N-terminal 7TM domain-containing protein [Haloarculaceae archaeon]
MIRVLDVAALAAVGVMLVLAWTTAQQPERRFLVPMLVGVEAWVLGDLIAKSTVGLDVVYGAVILQLVASGGAVLCLLLFVLVYTGRGDAIRTPLVALLLVEPVGFGLLALTDPAHRLVVRGSLASDSVVEAAGPALFGHIAYSYLLVAVALYLAGELLYRAEFVYRRQATALVVGILAPFLGNVLYFFTPVPVDLTPIMFVVTGGALTYAALRADLLELSPMARSAVLDTISNGVLVLDRNGAVLDSNPQARRLLGLDGPIAVGKPVEDLPSGRDEALERLVESLPPDAERVFELDLAEHILEVRVTPLHDPSDRPVGAAVVMHDVTERERQRRALRRQRERLDQFASVVSHDLRNPLNVAAGGVALARNGGDLDDLDMVVDALDRMEGILEDTLTLARQGEAIGSTEAVDLGVLCEECWGMIECDGATIDVEPATISGDPGRLRHLFENLFRNAVEHGARGASARDARGDSVEHGSTSNRTEPDDGSEGTSAGQQRQAGADDAAGHAEEDVTVRVGPMADGFYVEDDGPGIPPEDRADVVQVGHSAADGGTGLGLAIVDGIAEAHGWELAITDGASGGARFEFTGVTVVDG